MEEEAWIRSVLLGDKGAFAHLVDRYKTSVYNLAYRMLGNPEDAEDAAQETFLRAYVQLDSYDPKRKFSSWLLSIAAHYCVDQLRRCRFSWLSLDVLDGLDWLWTETNQPEQSALDGENRDEVHRLLHRLPPKYRLVLILRYWYNLSYQEIADMTHMSEAAVKTRLHRAREMLSDYVISNDAARNSLDHEAEPVSGTLKKEHQFGAYSTIAH